LHRISYKKLKALLQPNHQNSFLISRNNPLGHYQSIIFLPSLQSAGNVPTAQVPAGFPLGQGYTINCIASLQTLGNKGF
jgi:hypothetical protein